MDAVTFPYMLRPHEPAILVEVYLPKRSEFQGTLFETLTRGFDIEAVKAHFLDPAKEPYVRKFLGHLGGFPREMISRLQPISFGYSMYEVDGVFVGSVGRPVEERVQVIRFIFRPDYGYIRDCYPGEAFVQNDVVKGFLGDTFHNAESYAQKHAIPASYRALLDYLADWKTQVGLFLFGYVVYEICERISKDGIRPEEQIWITYNRDFGVNRIVWSSEHSAAGVAAGGLAPRG